ncbi:helix-turn-helix domain-containing protein [Actinopolymorpha sp. B17G11]|uniref:IclR family transcriptional regulator n=1 Tax=unclassified Actinopolymorpha TaxID=2627063 RepID=UPI0032D94747
MREEVTGSSQNQALARGLEVLRVLVDESEPVTGTEIARRLGLHQSSISRILATLTEVGYVRKTAKGFAPDFGVLSLASATSQFPLIRKPRAAMKQIAASCGGLSPSLGMLWRGQMIYFLRTTEHGDTIDFWWSDYPIHLSAPGLRLLVDLPREEALAILRGSRQRYGWDGEKGVVPATEEEVLDLAAKNVAHDVIVLTGWFRRGWMGAAIPVEVEGEHRVALALAGPSDVTDLATLQLWLHDARRTVEAALRQPTTGR